MDKYEVYIEFLVFVLCFTDVSTSRQCYAIPCEHKAKALVFIVRSYRVDRGPTWGIRNALPPSLGWAGDRIRMPQLFHSMLLLNMQGDEDFITSTPCFNVVSVIIQVLRIHCQLSTDQLIDCFLWSIQSLHPFDIFNPSEHLNLSEPISTFWTPWHLSPSNVVWSKHFVVTTLGILTNLSTSTARLMVVDT